jgi:exodeoxyribonuclease VII large subunit
MSNSHQLIPNTALSVAGLTSYIQDLLELDEQLRQVWVIGEVSSTSQHRSGLFFTLQDPDTKATISCVVWTSQLSKLMQLPKSGEQLLVMGSIRLYPQRGQYQLSVWQALAAGEGIQAWRDRQLRDRLAAEGLFDAARKRPLPIHPQIIAVVTSPQAAAWGDIQKTLQQRYPGLRVLLSPATVQGEQAPDAIVAAMELVVRDGRAEVLILSRGGGAVEELACFNDERVVRAIAQSPIPVITGIGHQRDESLADLVADVSAHTPTAAAELAVPAQLELYMQHQQRYELLVDAVRQQVEVKQGELQRLRRRLQRLQVDRAIAQQKDNILRHRQYLGQLLAQKLQGATQHCQLLRQKLAALDPQAVLQRGYAVVRQKNGAIARSTANLKVGQELSLQLGQGQIKVKIIKFSDP